MKILVINGPNINILGIREKNVYGKQSYEELVNFLKDVADKNNINMDFYQSNHEGFKIYPVDRTVMDFQNPVIRTW